MQSFKQWLSNQSPKTFSIDPSTTISGKFLLRVGDDGQIEGEIDNFSNGDLQALQQLLNQKFPQPKMSP
jgi:hypothetical protein